MLIKNYLLIIVLIVILSVIAYFIWTKRSLIFENYFNPHDILDKYNEPEVFFFSEGYPGTPYTYYSTEDAIKAINNFNIKTNNEFELKIANLNDLDQAMRDGASWDTHGFIAETVRKQYDPSYDYNKEDIDVYYTLYTLINKDGLPGIDTQELKAGGIIVVGKKPFKNSKYGRFVKAFNNEKWSMYD